MLDLDKPRPKWSEGVPRCALEECEHYDGKRCELMGFRPDGICEPAVSEMQAALEAADRLAECWGAYIDMYYMRDEIPEAEVTTWARAVLDEEAMVKNALAAYRKARHG